MTPKGRLKFYEGLVIFVQKQQFFFSEKVRVQYQSSAKDLRV